MSTAAAWSGGMRCQDYCFLIDLDVDVCRPASRLLHGSWRAANGPGYLSYFFGFGYKAMARQTDERTE